MSAGLYSDEELNSMLENNVEAVVWFKHLCKYFDEHEMNGKKARLSRPNIGWPKPPEMFSSERQVEVFMFVGGEALCYVCLTFGGLASGNLILSYGMGRADGTYTMPSLRFAPLGDVDPANVFKYVKNHLTQLTRGAPASIEDTARRIEHLLHTIPEAVTELRVLFDQLTRLARS